MHASLPTKSPPLGTLARRFAEFGPKRGPIALVVTALLAMAGPAEARIEGQAVPGEPFGVGRISFSAADVGGTVDESRLRIEERDGRVYYPATTKGPVGRVLGQILGEPEMAAGITTVHFLFQGKEPLRITFYAPEPRDIVLTPQEPAAEPAPRPRPRLRLRIREADPDRLLDRWWRDYTSAARRQINGGDHPPLVQDYLTMMLASRLSLEAPRVGERPPSQTYESLQLLAGVESLRRQALQATMLGEGDFGQRLVHPLPEEPAWRSPPLPPLEEEVEVEPLARHVPADCFYVRFGRFSNYLWLNKLVREYGGDLASMVTLRGYFPSLNERVQRQFGLETSRLAELFGEQVISDVALIGRDTYMKEGAAVGILFQAKSTEVLGSDLTKQRRRALDREKERGATEEVVKIGGRDVSFVSTPDNRLRSFHAIDGDYHLVTTSRAIVERFFETGEGKGSLGESDEFRHARARFPNSREDTVFIYMSSAFFEGLLSPQYQVELRRRLASVTDMELLTLARLAAEGEGSRAESIEELVDEGFLPRGFGRRPDGSGPIETDDTMIDSRRGARGTFLPVPDVEITALTDDEADRYAALARAYSESWRQMDPLTIAVKRVAVDKEGVERVAIDGVILSLDEGKYGWILSILGEPTRELITPARGDVISVQAQVRGGLLLPQIPPHHLFLGVQDIPPAGEFAPRGFLRTLQMIRGTPGYLGGWPKPGFLDLLPAGLGGTPPDEFGFSQLPLGLWKREGAGFAVLSFDPQLLAEVTPQLRVAEAQEPAQIRVHVGDLSEAKIAGWINRVYYQRAAEASEGNVKFLHLLHQQLHVPLEECRDVAEELLDARLRCTLGGEYELADSPAGKYWRSSAAPRGPSPSPPDDYVAPLLAWFRGLDASLIKHEDRVVTHLEIDIERHPEESPPLELPFLDVLGRGLDAFRTKEKQEPAEELPPPLPPVPQNSRPRREP